MEERLRFQRIDWIRTFEHPTAYIAEYKDSVLILRINENHELPYTLLRDGKEIGYLRTWPPKWRIQ